jgi:hypothetical protein
MRDSSVFIDKSNVERLVSCERLTVCVTGIDLRLDGSDELLKTVPLWPGGLSR